MAGVEPTNQQIKKALGTSKIVLIAVVCVILVIIIFSIGSWAINNLPQSAKSFGAARSSTTVEGPAFFKQLLTTLFGEKSVVSWENLILYFAIFMILLFALTAGIGAIGIGIIIICAVFAAVTLNIGIGKPLREWRQARQIEIQQFKTRKGFDQVSSFITGAKQVSESAAKGQKGK
ncbi:MAG: hypothetical protein P8X70_00945 [Nanoarchaeota archaeon]